MIAWGMHMPLPLMHELLADGWRMWAERCAGVYVAAAASL